jgi:branched-subunit amino acid ABC-type transport system permease component
VFGLMDVLNFGHGAFISVGAYAATLVLLPLAGRTRFGSILRCWRRPLCCRCRPGALGLVVERVLILPVYGQHLADLMTTGGLIIAEQLYAVGATDHSAAMPTRCAARSSSATSRLRNTPAGDAGRPVVSQHSAGANRTESASDPRR